MDASRVARGLALLFVDAAFRAGERLKTNSNDKEALHDMRVALRQLRSTLSLYRQLLGPEWAKTAQARLRNVASTTNKARDGEVQLAWLKQESPRLSANPKSAAAMLEREIRNEVNQEYRVLRSGSIPELEASLSSILKDLPGSAPAPGWEAYSFQKALGKLIREQTSRLRKSVRKAARSGAVQEWHAVRIKAKKLRYLIEPFAEAKGSLLKSINRLQKIQELLGELHDVHVLKTRTAEHPALRAYRDCENLERLLDRREQSLVSRLTSRHALRRMRRLWKSMDRLAESPL